MNKINFDNTEVAFSHLSDKDLRNAKRLFALFNYRFLISVGPKLTEWALRLHLPIKGLVRNTIFKHFCGGEDVESCDGTSSRLFKKGVGSILDYSVEGVESEDTFERTYQELRSIIEIAQRNEKYPFAVFKPTGIVRFELLEKVQNGEPLDTDEESELERAKNRFKGLCAHASALKVKLCVDAEESWIQNPVDEWAVEMMQAYNTDQIYIFNTLQMYRTDRLDYLREQIAQQQANPNYKLGFKLVRGAYMEKERERAQSMGYESPIQPTKEESDSSFNEAAELCATHYKTVALCLGTHNEESSKWLAEWMIENGIERNHPHFWFAQLYGMSDNISFNLAQEGFNVAKYLPYGPILSVLPYLARRAVENSSVSGQVGREMGLIMDELQRRVKSK